MHKISRPLLFFISIIFALLPITALHVLAKPDSKPQSPSANITVTTPDDELNGDGDCSLREALQAANTDSAVDVCPAGSGADTIIVPSGRYTFTLPTAGENNNLDGDLDISQDVTITGAGADKTILNGNSIDRIFHITSSAATVTISNLTITSGSAAAGNGGGVFSSGNLTLVNVEVSNNSAPRAGGIATDATGTLNIWYSSIHHNVAPYTGSGTGVAGGIEHFGPSMVVVNTTVSDNTSGYFNATGNLRDSNGTGNTTVIFSTISNNIQGGLYTSGGIYKVESSIIANNSGGNCNAGTFASGDYNISSSTECGLGGANDLNNTDPLLEPLQYAGGPTQSRALQPGSPSLDRIPSATNGCGTTYTDDQRGFPRPDNTMCDSGAVEGTLSSGPDLTISFIGAAPKNVCQGEDFSLTFAVTNQGAQNANAHEVLIYDDSAPTGFTNPIFEAPISSSPAGQTSFYGLTMNSFITGTRYIKAFADGYNSISETDELNNSNTVTVTVQTDPAPTGTILINGGASSSLLPNLTLTLFASDTGNCVTSPTEMRFTYDGLITQWEPFATTKDIIVSSSGEVTVSVQFKDENDNTSPWIDATITVGDMQKIYLPIILR